MSKYLLFFSSFKCLHYGNTYNIIPKIPHILISPIKYIREFQTGIIIDYYMTFFILHINSRHQYSGADSGGWGGGGGGGRTLRIKYTYQYKVHIYQYIVHIYQYIVHIYQYKVCIYQYKVHISV